MKIAEGIAALPIEMNFMGNSSVIYPTLLWDEDNIVLVDTGTPGMLPGIRTEIGRAGVDFDKLNTVILTHQDIDHIGSMPEIAAAAKQPLLVLAHEEDRSSIEGDRPFVKFNRERFGPRLAAAPEAARKRLEYLLDNPPTSKISRIVSDGELLPYAGGVTVIFTPGHTPGHICLYHHASQTLIAADELNIADGRLSGPSPGATPDMETALRSLAKLASFEIRTIISYHGGVLSDNAGGQLTDLIASHV